MTEYCRINLSLTSYSLYANARLLTKEEVRGYFDSINDIYIDYCRHKKFKSVMPIFYEEFMDPKNDIIGYYDKHELVAWSLLDKLNGKNVECVQFAWNYKKPNLKLGYKSIMHECAYYKNLGFDYLYLGESAPYKSTFMGYEVLGEI